MGNENKKPNSEYISWLEKESLLHNADKLTKEYMAKGEMWQNPFSIPDPRKIVEKAPVWFNSYPNGTITGKNKSFLEEYSSKKLWETFEKIGIQCLHTGPVRLAGGLKEKEYTPTIDGWFDRIKYEIDPSFGTEEEYKKMVKTAKEHKATIAADVVPGHTGKGADFRLATMGYKEYPGIYTMVEIKKDDWDILPEVNDYWQSENLSPDQVLKLHKKGYIPGKLQRVLFTVPGEKREFTGWDATDEILCVDGKTRRWVYLHYFKQGQPTLNWLDPTCASNKIIYGDLIKSLKKLGAGIVRLDANSFLGIEPKKSSKTCWSEGHPLSVGSSNNIAFMARKLGGATFQELNLAVDAIAEFSEYGADLSYDFITRPAAPHALLTGDATFLHLSFDLMQKYKIDPALLIHDMQNHDEFTYELVHFMEHPDEMFNFGGKQMSGKEIRDKIISQMHHLAIGVDTPYNRLSGNGLCTTYACLMASRMRISSIEKISKEQANIIKKGHYLMAIYNAMQPGVFGISAWDMVGALNIPTNEIPELLKDGDFRWINRGSVDLMGDNEDVKESFDGMPRCKTLYKSVPKQLEDKDSFLSLIKNLIEKRNEYKIHLGSSISYPKVKNIGAAIMVHNIEQGLQVTALNFGNDDIVETINLVAQGKVKLENIANKQIFDIITNENLGFVDDSGNLKISLRSLEGKALIFK